MTLECVNLIKTNQHKLFGLFSSFLVSLNLSLSFLIFSVPLIYMYDNDLSPGK